MLMKMYFLSIQVPISSKASITASCTLGKLLPNHDAEPNVLEILVSVLILYEIK